MSNSQNLKRINLQNLRIYASTLRLTAPLHRGNHSQINHPPVPAVAMPQQAPAEVPRANARAHASVTLVQRQVLCFSHVFLYGPFWPCQKPSKNGNTNNEMSPQNKSDSWEKMEKYVFDILWYGFDQIDQQKQHRENLAADLSVEMILHGMIWLSRGIKPAERHHPRAFAILSIISGCFHWCHIPCHLKPRTPKIPKVKKQITWFQKFLKIIMLNSENHTFIQNLKSKRGVPNHIKSSRLDLWNILKHIETYWNILKHIETYWHILKHIETYPLVN